jgi:anti-anti-sigma factor
MVSISQENRGNVLMLKVAGRVDAFSASELDLALQEALKARHQQIVVDLSGTEFISSAGLRALLHARRQLQDRRGDIRLAGLSEFIHDGFKLAGFDHLFKIYDTSDAAVASF